MWVNIILCHEMHFMEWHINANKSLFSWTMFLNYNPGGKVHGANMGPIWGQQDLGGSHIGPMNFAICEDAMQRNGDLVRGMY